MSGLTHFDAAGAAHMVDVAGKSHTRRVAVAAGAIVMQPATLALIRSGTAAKGDVLGTARLAAVMAAKRADDMIPLCHPVRLTRVAVAFACDDALPGVRCQARVEAFDRTGVEIEALLATQIALLTIYDMCKAVDRAMEIRDLHLREKVGGRSGHFVNDRPWVFSENTD